ncbi:hypothetical protein [Jannaschia aquimarina]|uniref:Uncharacterized protein n=1 Tax=Jannaschia aquimarina TaxID=935700 RepID=A0A0D1CSR6_9RHOB|nr:hypothetical protein [Jannaschia aquimarina]KIT17797.1 hypothetical protein jaqu_03860 [Jannaschia aquimarina]SNS91382.1 hypothetical protein SAMN05421775_103289 [Jannaschia aquimarina]
MRFLLPLILLSAPAFADSPVVEAVEATRQGDAWRFDVTVSHPDTGWDHYADGWRVEAEDGTELGMRVLHHPHVEEQPFTRSLSGVAIPDGTARVVVRARDSVHGWGEGMTVDLN